MIEVVKRLLMIFMGQIDRNDSISPEFFVSLDTVKIRI